MERITYRITLDTHKNGIQRTLQGFETADNMSRRIAVNFTAGGDTYELPYDNTVALIYITMPNAKEPSINECVIKDDTIVYDMLPVVEEGITEMQIKLIKTSIDGAKSVIAAPKFAIEVTKSNTDDEAAEQTTTFTALENAVARANAVYDARLVKIEIDEEYTFRAYYADGAVYENDVAGEQIRMLTGYVELMKEHIADAKESADNASTSEENARQSAEIATERAAIALKSTEEQGNFLEWYTEAKKMVSEEAVVQLREDVDKFGEIFIEDNSVDCISGLKGFYYKAVDKTNKIIYLTKNRLYDGSNYYYSVLEVLSGYYFTADSEFWTFGYDETIGWTWLGSAATSWENGALKRSANAAGASLWSPTLSNVDASEADQILLRVKVDGATEGSTVIVQVNVVDGETSVWKPYSVQLTEDILAEDGYYEVKLDLTEVNSGTISKIGITQWYDETTGAEETQTFYMDSCEIWSLIDGDNEGSWAVGDTTYASLAKGYYFQTAGDEEGFGFGGEAKHTATRDLLIVTGGGTDNASIWSPKMLDIAAADADTIRIRINTEVESPQMQLSVKYTKSDNSTKWFTKDISYTTDEAGWAVVTVDLSKSEYHTEDYVINELGLYPLGVDTDAAKTGTAYIDYIEVLKKAGSDTDGGNTDEEVLSGYYFTADRENWGFGGTWLGSAATSWENGALKRSAEAAGASLWSPMLNVDAAKADYVLLRVKVEGATKGSTVNVAVQVESEWKYYSVQLKEDILATDSYYEVKLDLTGINTGTIKQIGITQWYDATEGAETTQTFYMDSCEIWGTADSE